MSRGSNPSIRTTPWRLNAAAFGVPQHRIRYFLVAAAPNVPFPAKPEPEYGDLHGTFDDEALPPIRLDEAIQDLPPREPDSGEGADAWPGNGRADERSRRRYLVKFGILSDARVLYNHTVRYHNPRDLELYALLRPGENSQDAIDTYGRDDLMRYRRDAFQDKYNRLPPDRPSKTIVSHLAKDGNGYIHPTQPRSISIREAARLQSFPDDYAFCGSPRDQWMQRALQAVVGLGARLGGVSVSEKSDRRVIMTTGCCYTSTTLVRQHYT